MQVMFNSQERTLREIVKLAASVGWKVVKVTRDLGLLFGYLIAVPVLILVQDEGGANNINGLKNGNGKGIGMEEGMRERE
jgi:hypothetical protein